MFSKQSCTKKGPLNRRYISVNKLKEIAEWTRNKCEVIASLEQALHDKYGTHEYLKYILS